MKRLMIAFALVDFALGQCGNAPDHQQVPEWLERTHEERVWRCNRQPRAEDSSNVEV